ncbi:MAG: 4Fe-4S binding protein [Spirochaetia bacterium]
MTGVKPGRHPLRIFRIVTGSVVFILFLAVLTASTMIFAPLRKLLLSLQLFPAFINSVLAGGTVLLISWGGILLLTFLFGRVYCSVLCPLGILQDLFIFIAGKPGRKGFRYRKNPLWIRLPILAALITAALAGSFIMIDLLEPYSLFGRIIHDLGRPLTALGSHGISRVLENFGVYTAPWTHPLNIPLVLISAGILIFLAVISVRHGRWFCSTLCPAGTVLSLPGKYSRFRISLNQDACIQCGKCEGVCRAGCIDSQEKKVDQGNCVACFDCLSICPADALEYTRARRAPRRKQYKNSDGVTRRDFLKRMGSSSAAGAFLSAFPVSFLVKRRNTAADGTSLEPASPPGSGGINRFTGRCTACHLCVSRCPTHVLQPSLSEYGLRGIFQPVMDYRTGFCDYQCNVCSQVCPTGAIKPVTLEQKRRIQIGEVRFIQDRCIVFSEGTACGACAEMCPTHAVHMVPHKGLLTRPETDVTLCIGCGNCEYACPVEGKKAIYVTGKTVHSTRRVPEEEKSAPGEPEADRTDSENGGSSDEGRDGFPF